MAVRTTTDADEIDAHLTRVLEADPVRNTSFSSVRAAARRDPADVWCALSGDSVAARSKPAHPIALTHDWTDMTELAGHVAELPGEFGVTGRVDIVEALAAALDRPSARRLDERLFRLDELTPPADVPGRARPAGAGDLDLLGEWLIGFHHDAFGPLPDDFDAREQAEWALADRRPWLWIAPDGEPVSMAARQPNVVGVARIGPVYTPPEQRGHGYGSAATARATQDILDSGAVPVLFTDLANPTSNKIYEALGYRRVEDRLALRFA